MKMIKIHNAQTGEVIEREMNAEELAQWEATEKEVAAKAQQLAAKQAEKAALLDRLGISEAEAKLLLS